MTIPTGHDAGQQNVLSPYATGSRFVAGDAREHAVGLMTEGAIGQPALWHGGLHDRWGQPTGGLRRPRVGLRSTELR